MLLPVRRAAAFASACAECAGRHAGTPAEHAAEMHLVVKAGGRGDLMNSHGGGCQQHARGFHLHPQNPFVRSDSYGGAEQAMCSRDLGADQVIAWPTAEVAVMGAEGAANIIFRGEIEKADNPEEMRKLKIEEYRDKFSNPYVAAAEGLVDRVIDPRLSRPQLIQSLEMCLTKERTRLPRKHGCIPL